jgi:hypothetical protein
VPRPRSLPAVRLGTNTDSTGAREDDYAQLSRQVKQAGLLERRPGRYIWKITVTAALLAAGWAVFVLVGDSWWQLAVAAFLAVMFTQAGFLATTPGTGRSPAPGGPVTPSASCTAISASG